VKVLHAVTSCDRVARKDCKDNAGELGTDKEFLRKTIFSDTSSFQVSGEVEKVKVPI
jgi:hypothetical protein